MADSSFKRRKTKKLKLNSEDADTEILDTKGSEAEILDTKILREGLLILGCVTSIDKTSIKFSLPGCHLGVVKANNISNEFSAAVTGFSEISGLEEPTIASIIEVGMVFPCKVIKIENNSHHNRNNILLSIKPDDINANLKPSLLYLKMVLYVSICSEEDHGYIVNIGTEYVQGFLPKQNCDKFESLKLGQVIPTFIQKILFSDKLSAKVQLSKLDFNQEFPKVSVKDIKLHSILPGAKISADVIEVKKHFLMLKFLDFDVCASLFHNGSSSKELKIGKAVQGTVLCVNPVTHMIHLSLHPIPVPNLFPKFFPVKKFEIVEKPRFLYFFKNRAYFKISKETYGFINVSDLPSIAGGMATVPSLAKKDVEKSRVMNLNYMDNLIQMTAKPLMVEKVVILPEDIQVGDIYDAVVQSHVKNGMFVKICLGLHGFIQRLFMSDAYITKPEVLYPVGSTVKCRVLSSNGQGKVNLSCKGSLLNLEKCMMLSSYNGVYSGQYYKGVIVKKSSLYILILFFNDVKGIVLSDHIPKSSVFFEGQTVLCKVLQCNPGKKNLKLSLKIEEWYLNVEKDETSNEPVNLKRKKKAQMKSSKKRKVETIIDEELCDQVNLDNSLETLDNKPYSSESFTLHKAVIKNVKHHQLNIMLKNNTGRVHITELGCKTEEHHKCSRLPVNEDVSSEEMQ